MNRNHKLKGRFTSVLVSCFRLALLLLLIFSLFSSALAQERGRQEKQRHPGGVRVRMLSFTVRTSDDDLRGGNDNLNVGINFRDRNLQFKPNVNRGRSWGENSTQTFDISLQQPVPLSEIDSIDFKKPTGGGYGTDEWHMQSVSIRATGDGIDKVIGTHGLMIFNRTHEDLRILVTPAVAGKANKLELTIKTGGDDLHGGGFNLDLTIHFRGGDTQLVRNVNAGQGWANDSTHVKTITLDHAVAPADIVRLDLRKFGGMLGEFPDNWDMDSISVRAIGQDLEKLIARHGFFRFTQSESALSIPITQAVAGKASKLELTIQTGGDDLRGDNDNLNIIVHFRGGGTQHAQNVNGGIAWGNNSMHIKSITLNQAMDPSDIVEVDLQTTFGGGSGGDNWDMDSIIVKALGEGVNEVLFRHGARRFTHDNGFFVLRRGQ